MISCLFIFIFLLGQLYFLLNQGIIWNFCLANMQNPVFSYNISSTNPSSHQYKRFDFVITTINTSGIFANLTRTDNNDQEDTLQDYQINHVLIREDNPGPYNDFWDSLTFFHFILYSQVPDWSIFQDFISVGTLSAPPMVQVSPSNDGIKKLHDDIIWFQNSFRLVKWFRVDCKFHSVGSDISTQVYMEYVFDASGVLILMKNLTIVYQQVNHDSIPIDKIYTEHVLSSTTLPLSFTLPIECFFMIILSIFSIVFIFLYFNIKLKGRGQEREKKV